MKVVSTKTRKDGKNYITVELAKGEKLLAFDDGKYYELGGQVADIVQGHVITEAAQVYWCSITQRWLEA